MLPLNEIRVYIASGMPPDTDGDSTITNPLQDLAAVSQNEQIISENAVAKPARETTTTRSGRLARPAKRLDCYLVLLFSFLVSVVAWRFS